MNGLYMNSANDEETAYCQHCAEIREKQLAAWGHEFYKTDDTNEACEDCSPIRYCGVCGLLTCYSDCMYCDKCCEDICGNCACEHFAITDKEGEDIE